MPHEIFKYLVQPVLLERDDEGNVVGESALDVVALYSQDQLRAFVEKVEQGLNGGSDAA